VFVFFVEIKGGVEIVHNTAIVDFDDEVAVFFAKGP
jgi:hypothetical protein